MKLIPTAALLLVLAAPAFAASPVKTLPGDITLAQAQAVVRSAQAKAEAINVPMNIAVVDAGGNLKAFARMDDACGLELAARAGVAAAGKPTATKQTGSTRQQAATLTAGPSGGNGCAHGLGGLDQSVIDFAQSGLDHPADKLDCGDRQRDDCCIGADRGTG